MDEFELARAIGFMDLEKVKKLLATELCSLNGSAYPLPPPIVVCVNSGESGSDARRTEILKLLLSYGAKLCDVEERGMTLAMLAAMRGDLSCLKILCDSGETVAAMKQVECETQINHMNDEGRTALMLAASDNFLCLEHDRFLCLEHLVTVGADIDVKDKNGYTALMHAIETGFTKAVRFLLKKGADFTTISASGDTPLLLAFRRNLREIVTELQGRGALFSTVTPSGHTFLSEAFERERRRDVPMLLRQGVDPTVSRRDRLCLHTMVARGPMAVVRALVMHGFPALDLECRDLFDRCM